MKRQSRLWKPLLTWPPILRPKSLSVPWRLFTSAWFAVRELLLNREPEAR